MSLRDEFLKPRPRKVVKVELEDAEMAVWVRKMTPKEQAVFHGYTHDEKGDFVSPDPNSYRQKIVIATCCDEEGNLLFTDEDFDKLGELTTFSDMDQIAHAALELMKGRRLGNSQHPTGD